MAVRSSCTVSPKRRVGFLTPSNHSPVVAGRIAAFRSGLAPAGSAEAADAEVVVRAANNQIDKLPALAVDLVGRGVQVPADRAPDVIQTRCQSQDRERARFDVANVHPAQRRRSDRVTKWCCPLAVGGNGSDRATPAFCGQADLSSATGGFRF